MPVRVVVFDVIETLLDLNALRPSFAKHFGDDSALDLWFTQLIQSSFMVTVLGNYSDFGAVARHALELVSAKKSVQLGEDEKVGLLAQIGKLPAHPDAAGGLALLRDGGVRLATLTNSRQAVAEAQLTNAGLRPYFDNVLSVEASGRFKPTAEVYRRAAAYLGIAVEEMRLVAAHDWDVTGAIRAGARAAFVARPGQVLGPLAERPDIIGKDIPDVARQVLSVDFVDGMATG